MVSVTFGDSYKGSDHIEMRSDTDSALIGDNIPLLADTNHSGEMPIQIHNQIRFVDNSLARDGRWSHLLNTGRAVTVTHSKNNFSCWLMFKLRAKKPPKIFWWQTMLFIFSEGKILTKDYSCNKWRTLAFLKLWRQSHCGSSAFKSIKIIETVGKHTASNKQYRLSAISISQL